MMRQTPRLPLGDETAWLLHRLLTVIWRTNTKHSSGRVPAAVPTRIWRITMGLSTILLIILILLLLGAIPSWPHSRNWGYYPSGGIGLVLVVIIILMLMNRFPY
jgi:hypothetical protein